MLSAISSLINNKTKKIPARLHQLIIVFSLSVIFIVGPYLFYNINFMGKVFPNIYVAGINIGGMSETDAIGILSSQGNIPPDLDFKYQEKKFRLKSNDLNIKYDYPATVNRAYNLTRDGNFFSDTYHRFKLLIKPKNIGLTVNLDELNLIVFLNNISSEVSTQQINPSFEKINDQIIVNKGTPGTMVDVPSLRSIVGKSLSMGKDTAINIPVIEIDTTLKDSEVLYASIRANKYLGKSVSYSFGQNKYVLGDVEILKILDPKGSYNYSVVNDLVKKISSDINIDPQTPKFEFDGIKVTEFAPAKDGIAVDPEKFVNKLTLSLDKIVEGGEPNASFEIPVNLTKPPVSTGEINNLGIKELIGSATSTYFHSIPGRVFNVNLAASRINGTLVAPGSTFSFNQTLGDVSKFTGYQQAYIISGGRTILGDGGGVCQVSTTLFRATLNAGLPIDQRSAHTYRVGYYEQNSPPGLDATVYSPRTDFKFINNTPGHILIQAKNDPKNYSLVFELYGTNDGRIATITKPVISNYVPPLPTVYQDDPTLPNGVLKQVDYAAAGSRVTFNYTVTNNNETVFQKTFVSNYQPWAAVYLRGTGTN